jgi:polysaccharide biosynthesis protein PslE
MGKTTFIDTLEDAAPKLTLRDIFTPLFRKRRIAIFTFCTVFLAACAVAWLWAAKYYVSNMQVVVGQQRSDPAVSATQGTPAPTEKTITPDQVSSEVALLQGSDTLRAVVGACGLADDWSPTDVLLPSDPGLRKAIKTEAIAKGLEKKIQVATQPMSDIIDIKYGSTRSADTPACVLQNLGKLYMEKHLRLRRPAGSTEFFAQETDRYRKALEDAEGRLTQFSQKEGIAAPEVLRTDMAQQLAVSEAALHEAHQAIAADVQRIRNLQTQMNAIPARSATSETTLPANRLLEQLQSTLLSAQLKRTQLLMKYDPSYPLVKETEDEIAQTQAAIAKAQNQTYVNRSTDRDQTYELLRADYAKTQADLAGHRASMVALSSSLNNIRTELVKLDQQALKRDALVREAKADESMYLLYLNKREQERTSDALDKMRIANVAISVPPIIPVLPAHSPMLITLAGFALAFIAGIATAYVAEYIDPSFRTPTDVHEALGVPVLAAIPRKTA